MAKTAEEEKELRFHEWLLGQTFEHIDEAKKHLWTIEQARASRYGRTEPIAGEADQVMWDLRRANERVTELMDKIAEQDPPGGDERVTLSNEDVERIATAVVEKATEDVGIDALMLHSVPYLHGSPGIVVDEERAKRTPCKCVEYKPGKKLCWSAGIIGALTDEQETLYCPTTIAVERPGTVSRMEKWQGAVDTCKAEIASIPEEKGEERMTTWMRCMSRELKARGIET